MKWNMCYKMNTFTLSIWSKLTNKTCGLSYLWIIAFAVGDGDAHTGIFILGNLLRVVGSVAVSGSRVRLNLCTSIFYLRVVGLFIVVFHFVFIVGFLIFLGLPFAEICEDAVYVPRLVLFPIFYKKTCNYVFLTEPPLYTTQILPLLLTFFMT